MTTPSKSSGPESSQRGGGRDVGVVAASTSHRSTPLRVAVVRNNDLEARELRLFDAMNRRGNVIAHAVGNHPQTPYGLDGLELPVHITKSLGQSIARLPFGAQLVSSIESRIQVPLASSIRLGPAIGDVDIINTRETEMPQSVQALRHAHGRSTRVVVSCFENIPFRFEEQATPRSLKRTVRAHADLFIANSPEAAEALRIEGVPSVRIVEVPLAVDTDLFSPGSTDPELREAWGVHNGGTAIVYAGRLLPEKGLVNLLIAARPLLDRDGELRLIFHGSGPEKSRLVTAVQTMGLARQVRFSPWVHGGEMPRVYRSADIVVLPSLSAPYWTEQFGFNLVEAMSCGRPVVAAASGSIPSVAGDAACLYPDYSIDGLRDGLREVLDNQAERGRLAEAGRGCALSRYSFDVVGDQMLSAYERALDLPKRSPSCGRPPSVWLPRREDAVGACDN